MANQFTDIEVFEGKNLSNLFEDIYRNQNQKKSQIKELINSLVPLVEGIGDATLLVPLIKEYLEIDVKNDEILVKLAQIIQRIDAGKKSSTGEDMFNFEDLQGLLAENDKIGENIVEVNQETKKTICQA